MSVLKWDEVGKRLYETGTSHVALYVQDTTGAYPKGVAWNGVTAITESPSGAEETALYADDTKYLSMRSKEDFGFTIEAYTYPDEWGACDGTASPVEGVRLRQQTRKPFGLAFKTILGNDTELDDHGYLLHLIYGATAAPSEMSYQTVNDSPEAITFSWECSTVAQKVADVGDESFRDTSSIIIDSTKVNSDKLKELEKVLFGDTDTEPSLPLPDAIITMLTSA